MSRARPLAARAALLVAALSGLTCSSVVTPIDPPARDAGLTDSGECAVGFADCNGDPADGCETDLSSDPTSCGACAHSCLGQACSASRCEPVVLATDLYFPRRIAVDPGSVYFTTADGKVRSVPVVGGAAITFAQSQDDVFDVAVDSSGVYWTCVSGDAVRTLQFGADLPQDLASPGAPFALAVNAGTVYFTVIYNQLTNDELVMRVPSGGGSADLIAKTPGAYYLAVSADFAYWTDENSGSLWSAPLGGGDAVELASDLIAPADLAVDADAVYFNAVEGTFRLPLAGGAPEALSFGDAHGLALDTTHVYFGTYDGRVMKVPRGGGEAVILAQAALYPGDIAVDGESVYWVEGAMSGTLRKVAK